MRRRCPPVRSSPPMWPRALVKAAKSGLTLSRQKHETRQSAPAEGTASWARGWGRCTSMGRMSAMTWRSLAAFSVHSEGLYRDNINKLTHTCLNTHWNIPAAAWWIRMKLATGNNAAFFCSTAITVLLHTKLRELAVPSSLQLADVLHVGRPVQVTSSLILEPVPQLLPVDVQEVCEQHLFENLTATQHLVQGGTWTHVHEQLTTNIACRARTQREELSIGVY